MSAPLVAVVTIGQTPRPDLLEPIRDRGGSRLAILEIGALDGLSVEQVGMLARRPDAGIAHHPLTTRLRDGSVVTLDEADLTPLVQRAVDRAGAAGADVTLLLCAGGFGGVSASGPFVRPFEAAAARASRSGARRLAVVVPYEAQASSATEKWQAAGFEVQAVVGDVGALEFPAELVVDAIVLDYVGHGSGDLRALRATTRLPVIDLGECGAEAALAALAAHEHEQEAAVP